MKPCFPRSFFTEAAVEERASPGRSGFTAACHLVDILSHCKKKKKVVTHILEASLINNLSFWLFSVTE